MRKVLLILFCLAACLHLNGRGAGVQGKSAGSVVAAIDREAEQWRCERVYNSDFNVPGDLRVEIPASVTAPAFRSAGYAGSVRAMLRRQAECALAATPGLTSEYQSSCLSAFAYGPDYYVYRLRRLII